MRGYHVNIDGVRLHLVRHPGPGREMLLIPGITSPATTWDFVANRLAETFDVHVLDVRGRGLSDAGDLDYSLDAMAADVIRLAKRMHKPVALGHSMGGRIAIRAARLDPMAFSALTLVDPPVSGPGRRPYPAPWSWYGDSIRLAQQGCSFEDMRPYFPSWTEDQLALRAEWLATCRLGAVRIAFDGFQSDDIHADIAQIKLPMRLVIAGGATVVLPEEAEEIRALAPHIEIRRVEGAGHMIPWDDLERFLSAVSDFGA
jgi:N-formylmaleamate deformylase